MDDLEELEEDPFDVIPEVVPYWHDGWDGACGAEVRDGHYEAYPHQWDMNITWCRFRYAAHTKDFRDGWITRVKFPGWIYRRALTYVRSNDRLRRYD